MPTITFIDPITGEGTQSGKPEYDPTSKPSNFSNIPDELGVYIWGMRVLVNGNEYFAPWCVGEGKLRTRLKDHYNRLCSTGSSNEELFDFGLSQYTTDDIQARYRSMSVYDTVVNLTPLTESKLERAVPVPHLIFWQDPHFIFRRLGVLPEGPPKGKTDHRGAIDLLNLHDSRGISGLGMRIAACKGNFDYGFYFLYAKQVAGMATKQMEHATKNALKSFWITTTAKAQGSYLGTTINLPSGTPIVYDLWTYGNIRSISLGPHP